MEVPLADLAVLVVNFNGGAVLGDLNAQHLIQVGVGLIPPPTVEQLEKRLGVAARIVQIALLEQDHADDQRRDLHGLRHVLMPEYDDQDAQHDRRRAQYDSPRPVALAVADVAQQDLLLGGEVVVARLGFKYEFHLLSPVIVLIFAQIYSTVLPVLASMNARKSALSPTTKRSSGRI